MKRLRTIACLLFALSAAMPVVSSESSSPADSDWARIADDVLHRSLRLMPGERVIIHYLPEREPKFVQALRDEIVTSGGVISAELTWPTSKVAPYLEKLTEQQRTSLAASQNEVYREIFARSDIYLWIDESPVDDLVSRQFEHLIAESQVRAVHCHFSGAPDPQADPALWMTYMHAIEVDPKELGAAENLLAGQLRGSVARLKSSRGTDLIFRVGRDAQFHINNGDASKTKVRNPLSTRDREEEIPSGDIRTTGVTDVEGALVGSVDLSEDTATLTFKAGRLIKVEPHGKAAEEFAKWFASASGDRDRIGELVIGNNPYLASVAAKDLRADFGYSAGTVRFDIGENWESGGSMRTGDHQQWAVIVNDGTLTVGRKALVERGKLVR